MPLQTKIDAYLKKIEQRTQDKLNVIGAWAVTEANNNLRELVYRPAQGKRKLTSNLINSINYATATTQGSIKGNTDGAQLEQPLDKDTVKIGTTVVYARRVELGFTGQDSLGRNYNQKAKPYLRPILKLKNKIIRLFVGK